MTIAHPTLSQACCDSSRRTFLKLTGLAAASALTSSALLRVARADSLTKAERDGMTPDQVLATLQRGNERFRQDKRLPRSFLNEQKASASGQFPAAVVLSCIDSRAPAEIVMDAGIGDLFNARVAGNVENEDILGSMEFACQLAGAKLVLVLGHTKCGAVKGAIDNAKLGNLTGLLAKIQPAVRATEYKGARTASNYDFVDAVARKNVELTIRDIRQHSAVLRELEGASKIKLAGAMYNLETAKIDFFWVGR